MIKQEKTLLTADTPWGEIKPLIGYVLSEREREYTKYRKHQISAGFFALYLYYFSFAYCKDMKNNPKRAIGIRPNFAAMKVFNQTIHRCKVRADTNNS